MNFPKQLTLQNFAYALDGGTTRLFLTDEQDKEHIVVLQQHAYIPEAKYFDRGLPGRLYFNETLFDVRSLEESSLLNLLKSAELQHFTKDLPGERIELSPNRAIFGDDLKEVFSQSAQDNLRSMLKNVIAFVESDEYIKFAEEVNRKLNEQQT